MTRKRSFGAVAGSATRVLILGSLPGDASLAAGRYYAHPQNRFWELVGAVIDAELRALDPDARLTALGAARIGVWDVVAEAARPGSLDSALAGVRLNDLAGLVATLPALRAVAFNGGAAARLARRVDLGVPRLTLPSSSAAHARVTFAAKRDAWLVLRRYLDGPV